MPAAKKSKGERAESKYVAGTLAIAVARSMNSKIGDAETTYAEQRSCPTSCAFVDGGGCYAEEGRVAWAVTIPLNRAAAEVAASPEDIARAEAAQIDAIEVTPGPALRIHTLGDCKTDAAAQIVATAAARYVARGGGPAWTYTHAWREVARESWGDVNVLASCETPEQVREARARGYTAALVVTEFPGPKRYEANGLNILPCPAQTKAGVTCSSCRLCMNEPRLYDQELTIAFEIHGTANGVRRAKLALADPDNPNRTLSSRVLIPRVIEQFRAEHRREPSNGEIADAIGITTSSVVQMRARLAAEENALSAESSR